MVIGASPESQCGSDNECDRHGSNAVESYAMGAALLLTALEARAVDGLGRVLPSLDTVNANILRVVHKPQTGVPREQTLT